MPLLQRLALHISLPSGWSRKNESVLRNGTSHQDDFSLTGLIDLLRLIVQVVAQTLQTAMNTISQISLSHY